MIKMPSQKAVYDPMNWSVWNGAGAGTADAKEPDPHLLYPELGDYRRIDPARYHTRTFMEAEWERMWTRTWTCAGHVADLDVAGSFFRYDLGPESFIVTRGHDGEVRAFYNCCQHRGRRLVTAERGRLTQFVCPFHSWAYDLKGGNVRVTDREMFDEGTLCGDLNLKAVRCEIWAGLIFINMDPGAPPLLEFLDAIPDRMAAYEIEKMHVVKDVVLPLDCNWKTGLEAFLEAYHLHVTHPQAMPGVEDFYGQFDVYRNGHARHVSPVAVPSVRMKDRTTLTPLLQFLMMDAGVDPAAFAGKAEDVRGAIRDVKRQPENIFGLDYSRFTDSQVTDDWNYFLFPNMTFNAHPEGILVMRFMPHPSDPDRFDYHVLVLMPKLKDGAKAPFYMGVEDGADISGRTRPYRIHSDPANPQLGEVLEQDVSNIEAVQQGLKSRGFPGGLRLAEHELRLQVFNAELDRCLKGLK